MLWRQKVRHNIVLHYAYQKCITLENKAIRGGQSVVPECGPRAWSPSVVPKYGPQIRSPSVVPKYSPQIWSPNMVPKYGP